MHLTGKLGVLAAWPFLLHGLQSPARMDWIRVSAPNLELLTTGEACVAAEAVADLESLRLYFRSKVPLKTMAEPSLRIVAFSSEREYQPFRLNARSPAYFAGGPGQATIVLGRLAKDQFPSLRHEFVHFLFRANRWQPPLWLEEGLAEFLGGVDRVTAQSRTSRIVAMSFCEPRS